VLRDKVVGVFVRFRAPLQPVRFARFDLLATLIAVVRTNGSLAFANAAWKTHWGLCVASKSSQLPDFCFAGISSGLR
jgi:hypothetical protein